MAKCAALAQQMAAARTIFLWLRRCRLHVRLARQTSWRQQRKATLARLQYKQDCCSCAALAEEQRQQAAAAREKTLADKADERRRQDALAKEQCHHEANKRRLQDALANEQRPHEAAAHSGIGGTGTCRRVMLQRYGGCDAAMAENALAAEQRHQELAECAAVTAENALAVEQRRRESAERAAATAEKALADEVDEQRPQKEAAHAAALAAMVLAKERHCHEIATTAAMVAEKAIAQLAATLAEMASTTEQGCHEAATWEKSLTDEANKQRRATALEKALANDANKQRQAAAQEKALADKANKQRRAAARDKALADEANKRRCHKSTERATTSATKALAEYEHNEDDDNVARRFEAYAAPLFARIDIVMAKIRAMDDGFGNWAAFGNKILAEEDDKASALTMPPLAPLTAVLPTPHHPTTYKDAVLATMGGSLRAKSLVIAPLSHPSTTVNNQPQMACHCRRPHCRVGCRHGPRAPNPQEHLLCGRRHRPRPPNQSTVNGWA
jgi:hypothetical protein